MSLTEFDISSKNEYPSSALSNFATYNFTLDGIFCNSMESFLQSLKFEKIDIQHSICGMGSYDAWKLGRNNKWFRDGILYWNGTDIVRTSLDYQYLLDRAYDEVFKHEGFKKALGLTGDYVLTHKMGKTSPRITVLTRDEFTHRLTKLRCKLT